MDTIVSLLYNLSPPIVSLLMDYMTHGLVLFYAKDRKLTAKEKADYKSLPLILFVSREPNDPDGKLSGKGAYDYKKGQDKSLSPSWRRPLSVISHVLNECPNKMKTLIENKWRMCPIILTYKHPYSISENDKEKMHIRKGMDHSGHINNILNILNDYNVKMVIDHSAEGSGNIFIPLKKNPSYVYLDTYLGSRVKNEALFEEIKKKFDDDKLTIIHHIWEEYLLKMGNQGYPSSGSHNSKNK